MIENEAIEYVRMNHSATYADLVDACDIVSYALKNALTGIKNDLHDVITRNEFDKVQKLIDYCKILDEQEKSFCKLMSMDSYDEDDNEDEDSGNNRIVKLQVDYSMYRVSQNEPHTMSEDYTHKRVCAFEFQGEVIAVSSWQNALVTLCERLARIDDTRIHSFVDDEKFKGRLIQYFNTVEIEGKSQAIPGTDLFVWINLSANSIVKLMKKILDEYGLSEVCFYLRADYTALHK